jgi:pimeloyl-ACP methyl ester carboxylesterase
MGDLNDEGDGTCVQPAKVGLYRGSGNESVVTSPKAAPSPTMKSVRCNGLRFPVATWGSEGSRPVLLLHGFPQEPSTWAPVAEALAAEGFQAFAPFQRGYVASTRPKGPPNRRFMQFLEDAIGIADALSLRSFDVVGFGMGGMQAWMLAAYQPARVRSLISLRYPHPAAFARGIQSEPEQMEKWRQLQQQFGAPDVHERAAGMLADNAARFRTFLTDLGLPQPFLDQYVERMKEPGALVGALSWERAISLEEFSKVPAVTVPTLLLWSEGPALSRATLEATKDYVHAFYKETLLSNMGHFMLETAPSALIAPLREHLQSA